ncbi:MAG: hypothetical protein R2779_04760 [Crocinitomicaceae bacterium]
MQLTVANDTLICENGTATLTASIGQTNAIYHWGHTTDVAATQLVQPTALTNYTVYAESAAGCLSDTQTIVVSLRNQLVLLSLPMQLFVRAKQQLASNCKHCRRTQIHTPLHGIPIKLELLCK